MELIVAWLTAWYNLPYLLALAVAMAFDVDADTDIDVDVDVDVDVDMDVSVADVANALDFDVDADTDIHDCGVPGNASFASNAMAFLGFGKAPAAVLGLMFLFLFGSLGFIANAALKELLDLPVLSMGVASLTMTANILVSGFTTGRLAEVLNRWLPRHDTVTSAGKAALHLQGTATTVICEKGGTVQLGKTRWVDAITTPGRPDIPKGAQVLLVAYDKEHTRYTAEPI